MAAWTSARAAAAIRASRGLRLLNHLPTGHGSGVLLSVRDSQPHVLGVGVVDVSGESVAIALSEEEAIKLRDALTEWLGV